MARCWLLAIFLIAVTSSVVAQAPIHVSSDVASSHLRSSPAPYYPSLAQQARIQGNVILHISIDEKGNASAMRAVSGHPLLLQAAVEAVGKWKYSPFEFSGHPVSVVTVAMVRFGNPANHDAEDRTEIAFQDKFWAAMDRARAPLDSSEIAAAEQSLAEAQTLLSSSGPVPTHIPERWQLAMSLGDLDRRQNRVADAEQQYTDALGLEKNSKESPQAAASLSALGGLYFECNKADLARDRLKKAVAIYLKNYKAAAKIPSAQNVYAAAIADDSWLLSKIALVKHQPEEAVRECRVVLDLRKSLTTHSDAQVTGCQELVAAPPTAAQ